MSTHSHHSVTVRDATGEEHEQLQQLAALDSAAPLAAPVIVGELDGAVVAAHTLRDGRVIADPFVATGDVTALLRTRASQLIVHRFPRLWRRQRPQLAWSV
jgi:hypothetical protein